MNADRMFDFLHEKFGEVVFATDDVFAVGEELPSAGHMQSRGAEVDGGTVTIVREAAYGEYETQAVAAGFGNTCADCFDHYYAVVRANKASEKG